MPQLPRVLVAAPGSGQGKTAIATGLMAALHQRGLTVSGHKVGPDYIDPGYHALATARPGRNLDPHLQGEHRIVALLRHGALTPVPADIAVIEGVMGLFDGAVGRAGFASTAHVARLTGTPVLLVVDVSGASRSIAALVHGFATFDPEVRVAGVVLNKVGSVTHEAEIREALRSTGVPVLGAVARDPALSTPSRHLGLVPALERDAAARQTVATLGRAVAAGTDLDAVLAIARDAPVLPAGEPWSPTTEMARATVDTASGPPIVAVAGGAAFTFRYTETGELLAAAGLHPVTVDPLVDEALPAGCAGLYLGGGFPEVYAADLAANRALRAQVGAAAATGLPIVAECAGLLYLCRDIDGVPMVGAIDATATMTERLTLGYREASAPVDSAFAGAGQLVTGHEFHRTQVRFGPDRRPAWRLRPRPSVPHGVSSTVDDGILTGPHRNIHAAYLHVHWAGHPSLAGRFAHAVRRFGSGQAVSTPRRSGASVAAAPEPRNPQVAPPVGLVSLVGGGPGDPGLITRLGLDRLAQADVVVTDRLAPVSLLTGLRSQVRVIDVSKVPHGRSAAQEDINAMLVAHAMAGRRVVRLKGGDPFVFGRGMEEAEACATAGVPVEVIPGVSSAFAVPAMAGIPTTHRGLNQGVTVISGHVPPGDPRSTVDWGAIAHSGTTIVLMMAVETLRAITHALLANDLDPATPAACIENGTTDRQRVLRGRLADIADVADLGLLRPPAVTVIGAVAAFAAAPEPGPPGSSIPGSAQADPFHPRPVGHESL
jgi:cobyrinic acid a,c-diamide synthase